MYVHDAAAHASTNRTTWSRAKPGVTLPRGDSSQQLIMHSDKTIPGLLTAGSDLAYDLRPHTGTENWIDDQRMAYRGTPKIARIGHSTYATSMSKPASSSRRCDTFPWRALLGQYGGHLLTACVRG